MDLLLWGLGIWYGVVGWGNGMHAGLIADVEDVASVQEGLGAETYT
jgi:hypothetical protein